MSAFQFIKLSDLTSKIQQAIFDVFAEQTYWVMADITNYAYYKQKGYHYFDLVEKAEHSSGIVAKVSALAWGYGALRIKEFEIVTGQQFKNDIHVLIRVAVSYHQVHGLQITLLDIDTSFTVGLLEQQKQQTLQRLIAECADYIQKEGDHYVTRNNQLQLRAVIQKIAIITSGNSAGYQDFMHTLDHNHFGYTFTIDNYFTVVQGETKAELVLQRLIDIYNSGVAYDAVVIIRGGGAQTDFLIFDTYVLGRAVAKFPIPVITGIGHQKNETITDLMAHSATKTPTKAAELIIAHNRAFEESLIRMQQSILIRTQQLFSTHFQTLSMLNNMVVNQTRTILAAAKEALHTCNRVVLYTSGSILLHRHRELASLTNAVLASSKIKIAARYSALNNTTANLRAFSRIYLQNKTGQLAHAAACIKLMSPVNILKRGFAIIYQDSHIESNTQHLQPGNTIQIVMHDATLEAAITAKKITNEPAIDI